MKIAKNKGGWIAVVVALPFLLYGLYVAAVYGMQQDLLYPGRNYPAPQLEPWEIPGMQVLWLQTTQGKVEAWLLPAEASNIKQGPALIFAHGNGELIEHWRDQFDVLRRAGVAVLLVEYPGYGRSEGEPGEALIRETMLKAFDTLVAMPEVDPTRIVAYGQSLGGGAVGTLAAQRPLRALILQSTFTSLRPFAKQWLVPQFLLRDTYDTLAVVREFPGPVLVIHGTEDPFIPVVQGRELAAAARQSTYHEYACGHTCWDYDRIPLWDDVGKFLRGAGVITAVITPTTAAR